MATLGNSRKVYIVDSSTYTWLAGEQSNSVNLTSNTIEVSDKDTIWQKFIAGTRGGTVTVDVHLDNTASQPQHKMLSALVAGTTVKVFVGTLSSNSPSEGMACDAIVSSISDTNNNGEVASRSISLQLTGDPTLYPATA